MLLYVINEYAGVTFSLGHLSILSIFFVHDYWSATVSASEIEKSLAGKGSVALQISLDSFHDHRQAARLQAG